MERPVTVQARLADCIVIASALNEAVRSYTVPASFGCTFFRARAWAPGLCSPAPGLAGTARNGLSHVCCRHVFRAEAQLQKKAALEAAEAEARVEERLRSEEHRQWVARKAEVEEEQRRLHYAQRQAEKDSVAKRNQAEIEEARTRGLPPCKGTGREGTDLCDQCMCGCCRSSRRGSRGSGSRKRSAVPKWLTPSTWTL